MARAYKTMAAILRRKPARPPTRAPERSARYYVHLPPEPSPPFTPAKAEHMLETIMALIQDPPETIRAWTRQELANLYRLARRWRHRAEGIDSRWLVAGTRPGRLPAFVEKAIQPDADPAWTGADDETPDSKLEN